MIKRREDHRGSERERGIIVGGTRGRSA